MRAMEGSAVAINITEVRERIRIAAARCGRDAATLTLVAVGKKHPATALRVAAGVGQRDFGENYLQEALDKQAALADLPLCWHFIGPIQGNKTRAIAEHFDWVHSVDRIRIARRLGDQRPGNRAPLNVFIQVNSSGEASKAGIAPAGLTDLAQAIAELPRLRLRGLMALPAPEPDPARQRAAFDRVVRLQASLIDAGHELDSLSLGMSGDLEAAVEAGSTHLRIGTDIFGARPA